jgi:N-acetylglucosamine-6-phosphate deacetylase
MIIYSNKVYTATGPRPAYLVVEDGKITKILPKGTDVKADVDYGDLRIIPGIIDTHNHGAAGYRFDDATEEELKLCLKAEAAHGVTSILPTTTVVEQFPVLAKLSGEKVDGAWIAGIHSEGPFGSRVGEKGINLGYPPVDMDHAKKMVEAGKGKLKLVDVAPEVPGGIEAIEYFAQQGIVVSAYHTNANFEEANKGIDHGISVATHLGNVMTGLHHRDVGTMGACILRDEVYTELICDGLHVCLPMVELVLRMKPHDKIMMVSDNGTFLGAPVGTYRGSPKNEGSDREEITVTPDGFVLSKTGRLSGSSKAVIYGIKNLVEKLHVPLEEVVIMSSANPARKYGLASKGSINVGKDLDIAVIDDDYNVVATYSEGRKVFDAKTEEIPFNPKFLEENKLD